MSRMSNKLPWQASVPPLSRAISTHRAQPTSASRVALKLRLVATPTAEPAGTDPEALDFWAEVRAEGPFSWVSEIDASMTRRLGPSGTGKPWLTVVEAASLIRAGLVGWYGTENGGDTAFRPFPIDDAWFADAEAALRPSRTDERTMHLALALTRRISDQGYDIGIGAGVTLLERARRRGFFRITSLGPGDLMQVPETASRPSAHERLRAQELLMQSGTLPSYVAHFMFVLEQIEALFPETERGPELFSQLVRALSILMHSGDIPCPRERRSRLELYFGPISG